MAMKLRAAAIAALSLAACASSVRAGEAGDPLLQPYARPHILARLADGRRIHLVCMGQGAPAVIMTAGLGDWSGAWRKVQGEIARQTRACAWDRAGFGFSDPSPARQDLPHTVADLEGALQAAQIAGPYLILGHSMGAYESLAFADRHRREVVGMVLVDPSVPGQTDTFARVAPRLKAYVDGLTAQGVDELRACADPQHAPCEVDPPDYPPSLRAALKPYEADRARLATQLSLQDAFDEVTRQAVDPTRGYGDMPLVVLSAMNLPADLPPDASPEALAEMPAYMAELIHDRDRIAALSSRGENRRIPGVSHYIQMQKPEVVITAVLDVLAAARGRPAD